MKPRPKRRFGQHFLRDTGILARIEKLVQPSSTDCIVEIGAGDGALSRRIAPAAGRYVALEVDSDLMPALREALAPYPRAVAINADVLELDLAALLEEMRLESTRIRLVGNLPYNIASAIIHKLLRLPVPVADMTFMVQLEVAQRIISPPRSRTYGYLSVDSQHRADVRLLLKVPPACFTPRPKVMSAVVELKPHAARWEPDWDGAFDSIVKAAFAHRRKTLENSIMRHPIFGLIAGAVLENAGIDGRRRPEDLSVDEYERLTQAFCALRE